MYNEMSYEKYTYVHIEVPIKYTRNSRIREPLYVVKSKVMRTHVEPVP